MNISKFVRPIIGASAIAAVCLGANAATFDYTGSALTQQITGSSFTSSGINDYFKFTIGTHSSFDATIANSFQFWTGAILSNLTLSLTPSGGLVPGSAGSQAQGYTGFLDAGDYTLHVTASTNHAGYYTAFLAASPAPEPETYAMLLAGLGLMGAIARRRNSQV